MGAEARDQETPPKRGFFLLSRRFRIAAIVWLFMLLSFDLVQPPARQLTARAMLAAIDAYQAVLSPRIERMGARCRFEPTCSHYGEAAIRQDGALVGGGRAAWRVLRCGPWTPAGTVDPP